MATSEGYLQLSASKEINDTILANLKDIFHSNIEPDVVQMVLSECDNNVNWAIDKLCKLASKDFTRYKKTLPPDEKPLDSADNGRENAVAADDIKVSPPGETDYPTCHEVCDTARDSIYKSNEDLYTDGIVGPEVIGGAFYPNRIGSNSHRLERLSSHETVQESLSSRLLASESTAVHEGELRSKNETQNESIVGVSPDSDKSIEADASESITGCELLSPPPPTKTLDACVTKAQHSCNAAEMASKNAAKSVVNPPGGAGALLCDHPKKPTATTPTIVDKKGITQCASNKAVPSNPQQTFVPPMTHVQYGLPLTAYPVVVPVVNKVPLIVKLPNQTTAIAPKAPVPHATAAPAVSRKGNALDASKMPFRPLVKKEQILQRIASGQRVLVLLRGCPGSGKSTLAKELKGNGVIVSADSFFVKNGVYQFDPGCLPDAHQKCVNETMRHMKTGTSPVVIDNTNLESWEMEPYVFLAIRCHYFISLIEPETSWRYSANMLAQVNTHCVPIGTINLMLQKFDVKLTEYKLMKRVIPMVQAQRSQYKLRDKLLEEYVREGRTMNEAWAKLRETNPNLVHIPTPLNRQWRLGEQGGGNAAKKDETSSPVQLKDKAKETKPSSTQSPVVPGSGSNKGSSLPKNARRKSKKKKAASVKSAGGNEIPKQVQSDKPKESSSTVAAVDFVPTGNSNAKGGGEEEDDDEEEEEEDLWPCDGKSNDWGLLDLSQCSFSSDMTAGGTMFDPPSELSENMKDLLDIDFGMTLAQYGSNDREDDKTSKTENDKRNVVSCSASEEEESDSVKRSTLKVQNWELPPYPGFEDDQTLKSITTTTSAASPSKKNHDKDASFISLDDPLANKQPPTTTTTTKEEPTKDTVQSLKRMFSSVPIDALIDFLDKCQGDIHWAANLLLDSGYEWNPDYSSTPTPTPLSRSRSASPDIALAHVALAEAAVSSPAKDIGKIAANKHSTTQTKVTKQSNVEVTRDLQLTKLVLRIDPIFGMQLEQLFGPVGFHVSPETYYGSDLNVSIDMKMARKIHSLWSASLNSKFQEEESKLKGMINDAEYAKRLQVQEDARLAANLNKNKKDHDPDFPPLCETSTDSAAAKIRFPSSIQDMASRIKRQQLYQMFPTIDRKALDEVFDSHNGCFTETVQAIETSFCHGDKPRLVIAQENIAEYEQAWLKVALQESSELWKEEAKKDKYAALRSIDSPTYEDLRAEATLHYHRRQECYQRAQDAFNKNMKAVASFYSDQGNVHSVKLHELNKRAKEIILATRNATCDSNTIDLHMLYVQEAIDVLAQFLERKKSQMRHGNINSQTVLIITGKGNHSEQGVPRIKIAVQDFLLRHKYNMSEMNPGVFEVRITKDGDVLK